MVDKNTTANMLSKIKNAIMASSNTVKVDNSKMNRRLLDVMKNEGYIKSYSVNDDNYTLTVDIKYDINGISVIRSIRCISKPSRRVYAPVDSLGFKHNNKSLRFGGRVHKFSTYIVSTSLGVMSDVEARKNNVGGEIICEVAS